MCMMCHLTLARLLRKGLINKPQIKMAQDEIIKDLENFEKEMLSSFKPEDLEKLMRGKINQA